MKLPSLKMAYLAWAALNMIMAGHGFITGEYQAEILRTFDKVDSLPAGMTVQQMVRSFIIVMLCAVIAVISFVGVLVWQTSKNRKWALWTLTMFALWRVYDSVFAVFRIPQIYGDIFCIPYRLFDAIGLLIWLYIIFAAHKLKTNFAVEIRTTEQ